MDNCCHVAKLSPSADNSVLNPQNWSCNVCGTTESVWACLSCSNVACGRYISEHALKHYEESGHPLALEVNDRYVFCYPCGDYVLNDNAAGDIQVLRSCLHTISTRGHVLPSEVGDGHKRLLRSCSVVSSNKSNFTFDDGYLVEKDRNFTALCFRRADDGLPEQRPLQFDRETNLSIAAWARAGASVAATMLTGPRSTVMIRVADQINADLHVGPRAAELIATLVTTAVQSVQEQEVPEPTVERVAPYLAAPSAKVETGLDPPIQVPNYKMSDTSTSAANPKKIPTVSELLAQIKAYQCRARRAVSEQAENASAADVIRAAPDVFMDVSAPPTSHHIVLGSAVAGPKYPDVPVMQSVMPSANEINLPRPAVQHPERHKSVWESSYSNSLQTCKSDGGHSRTDHPSDEPAEKLYFSGGRFRPLWSIQRRREKDRVRLLHRFGPNGPKSYGELARLRRENKLS